jgi:methyl-accepting chemotaxis protein I, serine sensor receptor
VEEAAAASKAMEQQAQLLVEKVSFFSVTGGVAPVAVPFAERTSAPAPRANVRQMPARKPVKAAKSASVSRTAAAPMAKASGDDSAWQEF